MERAAHIYVGLHPGVHYADSRRCWCRPLPAYLDRHGCVVAVHREANGSLRRPPPHVVQTAITALLAECRQLYPEE